MQLAEIARRQHGVFSRDQALASGMTPYRIRTELAAGRWTEPVSRVYVVAGTPGTVMTSIWAAFLCCGDAVVSHVSAAFLHGFDVPAEPVWLTVDPSRDIRRYGPHVVRARLEPDEVVRHRGLPITAVRRAVFDCLTILPFRQALDMLDRAVQRQVCDLDSVADHARSMFGRPGAPQLRRLLRHAARDAHSEAERQLHALLRKAGIVGWSANVRLHDSVGRLLGVADVVFADARLVIEVDGRRWHSAEGNRFQRDRTRQNALVQAGYRVLRFTWDDLMHRPAYVVSTVKRMLAASA
ncbi:MAG: DUF559 domain-containing protein [Streptosporangiales bacterium]